MFRAGGHQVDAGGVDGAVSQQIRHLRDVPAGPVEHGGEQMPQVMGKDLGRGDPRRLADGFHFAPDLSPGDRPAAPGAEDRAGGDYL